MNIPIINHTTFKTREREVGAAIGTVAKISCKKTLEEEKKAQYKSGLNRR